ncbi:MAG: glycosyltransferase [Flavobacteriales bacterium]
MIELAFLILAVYVGLIIFFFRGWNNLSQYKDVNLCVTIVIAFRNEKENLPLLLKDLSQQDFPLSKLQILLVDDSSDDGYQDILTSYENIQCIKSEGRGKKTAVETGVKNAKYDIILTTDADCRLSKDWVKKMVSPLIMNDIKLVSGPVAYYKLDSLFMKLQAIEFMSLIGSGAGAIAQNKGFMCNGANMAFRKSIFSNTEQYIASGDDVFLLHHIKKIKGKMAFVKDKAAIVRTQPKASLNDFINQRKRWASKSSSYKDRTAQFVSLLVFLCTVFMFILLLAGQFSYLLLFLAIKSCIDFLFLKKLSYFFSHKSILYLFLPLQLLYPFYIIWVSVSSQFSTYEWKGRRYSK